MRATFALPALLGCCSLLLGCGGGDEETAQNPNPAPPPPPAIENDDAAADKAGDASSQAGDREPANANDGGGSNEDTGPDEAAGANSGSGSVKMIPAEGALAPHAKALSIVRPDHYAIVKFDLAGARKAQLLQDLPGDPEELAQNLTPRGEVQGMAKVMTNVDAIWVSIGPPNPQLVGRGAPPFGLGAYARFQTAEALKEATSDFGIGEMVEATHSGVTYFRPARVGAGPVYFTDGLDLYLSTDEQTIFQAIDAQGRLPDTPLLARLNDANIDAHMLVAGSFGPMKEMVAGQFSQMLQELPIKVDPKAERLPAQLEWGTLAIHLDGDTLIDIDADMDSPQSAKTLQETVSGLIGAGKLALLSQQRAAEEQPALKPALNLANKVLNAIELKQDDMHVDLALARLPEFDQIPEMVAAAQRQAKAIQVLNQGKQLAVAALSYEAQNGKYPTNIKNEAGNEVLSWRVALLPYLEQKSLYDQFDLQAAWDSEANQELYKETVAVYQTPAADAPFGTTWKMLPDMPARMMFIAAGVGKGTTTYWTQPDNFTLDPADPAASLGEEPEGGYVVAFRDGHIERLTAAQIKDRLAAAGVAAPSTETPEPEPEPEPQPEGPAARIWTHEESQAKVEAVFVKMVGGKVTLKRTDNGKEVTIPAKALSAEDQAYLKSLRK